MKQLFMICIVTFLIVHHKIRHVDGHGYMYDPPARNSMWRFGYPTPVNFDDNQQWCGNAATFEMNGYKCGICGDNYADPEPRDYEAGGKLALGIVVRRYSKGQTIDTEIELTANHLGTFEFKICPTSESNKEVSQMCLDQNVVQVVDQNGNLQDRYTITNEQKKDVHFNMKLQLPKDMTCSHCVLQWTYRAANSWGTCDNGTEGIGCGLQETFKNCADISILTNDGARPPPAQQVPPEKMVLVRDIKSGNLIPLVVRSQVCAGSGSFKAQPGIDEWCQENCMRYPPNCPEDKCKCLESCEAIGSFKNQSGSDLYCMDRCYSYKPKNCDTERCKCF